MAYIITRLCRDCLDTGCVAVCPVDCIYEYTGSDRDAAGVQAIAAEARDNVGHAFSSPPKRRDVVPSAHPSPLQLRSGLHGFP